MRAPSPRIPLRPFVFLDKDGTLVDDVPYSADPAKIRLMAGAGEALRTLRAAGFGLAIVSNQSGVGRGLFPEAALGPYRKRLEALLGAEGVELDAFEYCPHAPGPAGAPACDCRKPAPGLLLRVALGHDADLARSWMIGDILDDVEAGHRAGCRSVLVNNGHETEWLAGTGRTPDAVVPDLVAAARAILEAPAPMGASADASAPAVEVVA